MEIQDVHENTFVDLFASQPVMDNNTPKFGMEKTDTDLFDKKPEEEIDDKVPKEGEEGYVAPEPEEKKDADLFAEEEKKEGPGRKPKYDFTGMTGYFEDRIKSGKFVPIEEEDEKGNKTHFIPKTPEDFDEVIDIQVNYKFDQAKTELNKKWYETKSPAWQAVAKYAELVDDPTEIVPFLQGIQIIESVSDMNENEIDGAEKIIRTKMQQSGDSEDVIEEQIEALKTTDKLISAAKKYKPIILEQENKNLLQMTKDKKEQEQYYHNLVTGIRQKAIEAIEAPIFGKQKLKQEEKAIVYDLIGQPNEQTKGYSIYTEIDKLYENGDFETLKLVALLIGKKDSLISYISAGASDKVAENLQKKLRIATDSRINSGNDYDEGEETKPAVQRNQYNNRPRFGR